MAKKAKDKTLEQWLIPHLRDLHRKWPHSNGCIDAAKEKVHIGFFKNGNPEYKTMIRCAMCKELYDRSEIDRDHIVPIANAEGFKDWNSYIPALFSPPQAYQPLCKSCHYIKTQAEGIERRKKPKKQEKIKKDDDLY